MAGYSSIPPLSTVELSPTGEPNDPVVTPKNRSLGDGRKSGCEYQLPHWLVEPDAQGRWSVAMNLCIDTSLAGSRRVEMHEAARVPVWS